MTVNFQHLRAFYAVASDRSVTRAASRLNVSQPTLSKQIKALEDRYQTRLFSGNRPPLELTPTGRAVYEKARDLFALSGDIEALLGETPPEEGGLLRIGTDSPPYAAAFLAAYALSAPKLDFSVATANAEATNEMLTSASVDIAIVCNPIIHADYTYQPLYTDYIVAVAPATWSGTGPFPLSAFNEHTLLMREPTSRTRRLLSKALVGAGINPRRVMEFHTREMIREAVAAGLGLSVMFSRECPPDERLKAVPLDLPKEETEISGYIACRTDRKRHPAIRRALEVGKAIAPL